MKPKFSVITVHFNQLPLLKSTVENVVSQKGFGKIIEYIIVDGLSMDGTIDYLHGLKVEKSIHRIIERDKGIYDAMNKAIKAANGEYIIFINAGDQLAETDTLAKIASSFPSFEILYGNTEIAYESFTRLAISNPLEKFWKSLPFVHQSVLVKKEILLNNLFETSYKYCADYNQLSKLYNDKIKFTRTDLTIARIIAGGTSDANAAAATKEVFQISKKRFNLILRQRIYFRLKIIKNKLNSSGKKNLPKSTVNALTKSKYN